MPNLTAHLLTTGVVVIAGIASAVIVAACGNPDSAIRIFPAEPTPAPTATPTPSPTPTAVAADVSERADFLRKEAERLFDAWDSLWNALLRATRWAVRDHQLRRELERAIREFQRSDQQTSKTVDGFTDEMIASVEFMDLMDDFVDLYREVLPDVYGISDIIIATDRVQYSDERSIEAGFRNVESRLSGWSTVRWLAPK